MANNPDDDPLALKAGDRLVLNDGSVVEVTENPMDGVWLFCRYLSSPAAALVGAHDQPVYTEDVVAFAEPEAPSADQPTDRP